MQQPGCGRSSTPTTARVARADDRELLEGANVDPVVTSLEEVDVEASAAHRLARRAS